MGGKRRSPCGTSTFSRRSKRRGRKAGGGGRGWAGVGGGGRVWAGVGGGGRRAGSGALAPPPPTPTPSTPTHPHTPTNPPPTPAATQAKADLGWEPKFGLVDGLADSYAKDFGRGGFRKAADFETDDLILAKAGKAVAAVAA